MKKFRLAYVISESQFLTSDEKELLLLELIKIDDMSLLHEGAGSKALVGSAVLLSMLALYSAYINAIQNSSVEFRKCRKRCLNAFSAKMGEAKEDHDMVTYKYLKEKYSDCIYKCHDEWWERREELKKKKEELKEKIKVERAKLRKKKFKV